MSDINFRKMKVWNKPLLNIGFDELGERFSLFILGIIYIQESVDAFQLAPHEDKRGG